MGGALEAGLALLQGFAQACDRSGGASLPTLRKPIMRSEAQNL